MKTIDGREALELLERAVRERGDDYVYPKILNPHEAMEHEDLNETLCLYYYDGAPSCIVGLALSYEGATEQDFAPFENSPAHSIYKIDGVQLTDLARRVLNEAQQKQDGGDTWGDSLEAARALLASSSEEVLLDA